jgi:hypothetical protein
MRTVQVYIEGQRLDLFNDETISVTSKQQDIQDISKVFTDFSQSFSVPSTPSNDAIFQHFYQNDVDSTIDHNIRRSAFIEIDLTTFRTGTISSYQITFYGDITSLKTKFAEDKLQDLTLLNIYTHDYTGLEIKDRIIDGATNYVIRYPLIFNRDITYDTGDGRDISPSGTGSVKYNELFPAIRLAAIFGAIQGKYGVTFEGTFLTDKRFQNAYLYCKNTEDFKFYTNPEILDLTTGSTDSGNSNPSLVYTDYFSLTDDTLSITYLPLTTMFPSATTSTAQFHRVFVEVQSVSDISVTYYIEVIVNNQVVQTIEATGGIFQMVGEFENISSLNNVYQFRIKADAALDMTLEILYEQNLWFASSTRNRFRATGTVSLTNEFGVLNYIPDMKVSEFFTGILKMFNLTCYGTALDTFQVEPLDDWYAKGAVVDITKYTDIKTVNVDRIKLYKTVEFKYQESESATNHIFKNLTGRDYGNTKNTFDYDGGEYKVELPFENLLMQKFIGTNLQIGETINIDGNKYVPKPMIIYQYEQLAQQFRFQGDTFGGLLNDYVPFGQDVQVLTTNYTLNFNADISSLTNIAEQNTLFRVYYSGYLLNLFDLKNRQTTVKTNLPVSLLTNLRLNDRVIIRDKRYIIQSMKSNLNTGEVDFVLINDFRPISTGEFSLFEPLKPNEDSQCLDVRILLVEVCIPDNPNATTVLKTEDNVDYINTENTNRIRTEGGTYFNCYLHVY